MKSEIGLWKDLASYGAKTMLHRPEFSDHPETGQTLALQSIELGRQLRQDRLDIKNYAQHNHLDLHSSADLANPGLDFLIQNFSHHASDLVSRNVRLINLVLGKFKTIYGLPIEAQDDLRQKAFFGLYGAACNYDPWKFNSQDLSSESAIHFSSYACKCISGSIKNGLRSYHGNFESNVRHGDMLPKSEESVLQMFMDTQDLSLRTRIYAFIWKTTGIRPTSTLDILSLQEQMSQDRSLKLQFLNWDASERQGFAFRQATSGSEVVNISYQDEHGEISHDQIDIQTQIEETVPESDALRPTEEQVISNQLTADLEESLSALPLRLTDTLKYRYYQDMTLDDVATKYNVTRERIRQLEIKALRKMRHPTRSYKLRD